MPLLKSYPEYLSAEEGNTLLVVSIVANYIGSYCQSSHQLGAREIKARRREDELGS
jgi:hypothetical protein